MKFKLGGQEIDLLTVTELKDTVEPIRKTLADVMKRERPTDNDVQASATATAAGLATLDFGAPDAGQVWDVRRVSIIGQDVTAAAVTCTVRMFKRTAEALTIVDGSGVQVPTTATYSRHQATYKPGENLLVQVVGFTANGKLFGMIQVEQTRWGAKQEYTL
jgi:hypothetical protein